MVLKEITVFIIVTSIIAKLSVIFGKKRCESKASMAGKVVIVTGSNSGLGFETAKDLAARGGHVILACRDEGRALAARDRIVKETGNTDVVYKQLDLSSLKSVRRFAKNINQTEQRLDVLVNNAGAVDSGDQLTADGIVPDMQINYFGPFLLTLLLLPLLKKTKASRIVNLSSVLHIFGKINFDLLNKEGYYYKWWTYANSKLCMMSFTVELARRLKGTGVTVNAVHPGVIMTTLSKKSDLLTQILFTLICCTCSRSAVEGAQTTIYLAVADECAKSSGKYFVDCKESYMHPMARDEKIAADLWNYSAHITGYEH